MLQDHHSTFELHLFDLVGSLKDLFCLGLGNTLDAQHFLLGDHEAGEHSTQAMTFELVDVSSVDAMVLEKIKLLEWNLFLLNLRGLGGDVFVLSFNLLHIKFRFN